MVYSDTIWNYVFLMCNCWNFLKQGLWVVQSGAIWNDVSVVGTADKTKRRKFETMLLLFQF